MSFFVDENKKKDIRIFVKQEMDKVHVMGEDYTGRLWVLFDLLNDGTFKRVDGIMRGSGIAVDSNGRIIETKDF